MIKVSNRRMPLLLVLALLATLLSSAGSASATTNNTVVGPVPAIFSAGNYTLASLNIDEGVIGNIATNDVIVVTLPSGIQWQSMADQNIITTHGKTTLTAAMHEVSEQVAYITVTDINYGTGTDTAYLRIPFNVTVNSLGSGNLQIKIAAPGTAITAESYSIGHAVSPSAAISALSAPTRGSSGQFGTLHIIENAPNGITAGDIIMVKLPTGFTWDAGSAPANISDKTNGRTASVTYSDRTATITMGAYTAGQDSGIYDLATWVTIDKTAAVKGDIIVSISGAAKVTGNPIVIGKYGDYNTASFVIGASTYTLNGESALVVAPPYIKDGRTYLAVRDIGAALGIEQSNIVWDAAKGTVTMTGDKVVQLTIGSNIILINGAAKTMDVAPEIGPGERCMLPAALIAQEFGETATWDAATQTVNIK